MPSFAFDDLVGSSNSALLVVTTAVDDVRAGCLVGYHNQASMSPRHYSFWLSKANHTYRAGLLATHFAVHFLTEHDYELAKHFAVTSGQHTEKFADLAVAPNEYGLPLITALPNRMILERLSMLDNGGDHACVTGQVLAAESDGHFVPLRTADVGKLKPAHGAKERIIEP